MKPIIVGVLVLFVVFWMVQSPDSLADFTKESGAWVWDTTSMFFEAVIGFLGDLSN